MIQQLVNTRSKILPSVTSDLAYLRNQFNDAGYTLPIALPRFKSINFLSK